MPNFIPAPGTVLIKPLESDSIVASADRNYERMGEVLEVAEDIKNITTGDTIFFDEYSYRRFTYQEKDYFIVNVSGDALWGIIKKSNEHSTNGSDLQKEGVLAPLSPDDDVQRPSENDVPKMR